MKKRLIVFVIPILILVLMTIPPLLTLSKGTEVTLKTIPIDPSDIFRGDYVTLGYDIANIEEEVLSQELKDFFKPEPNVSGSIKVYTVLEEDKDGTYKVKSVSKKKPKGNLYIKGILSKYKIYEETPLGEEQVTQQNANVSEVKVTEVINGETVEYIDRFRYVYEINYNIDKFFVPENSGEKYEKASQKGDLLAVVKIYKGNAMLRDIKIK